MAEINNDSYFDTIVIGGGAAGLMAAARSARRGRKTLLTEKNKSPGSKLSITAKGRCNITNDTDIEDLISNIPGNGTFLYSTFYNFSNRDIISLLNRNGLPTKVERGGRVFPASDRAEEVVKTLIGICKKAGVTILNSTSVERITADNNRVSGIETINKKSFKSSTVILATGGLSYPKTGSTGDGYRMAEKMGHTIVKPQPSLVPLVTREGFVKNLQGLTLKNISVKFMSNRKTVYSDFGELLFTHFGVSGPVILSGSRHLLNNKNQITLHIDLKPALNPEKLDMRLIRDFEEYSRKQFKNSLDSILPRKMIPVIIKLSKIPEDKPVNQITKEERAVLVSLLKDFTLHITGTRPISEAVVTAGGIDIKEVEPSTMESKLIKGLFFAGEILDVDGYTGGYNLTIAFSTGYTAGDSC